MKKIIFLIVLILPNLISSQETWVKRYSYSDTIYNGVNCFSINLLNEGYFIVGGEFHEEDTTTLSLMHYKINWNGDVVNWGNYGEQWTSNHMGWVDGAITTNDGGSVSAGNFNQWAIDGVPVLEDSLINLGQLVKFDNEGNFEWNRLYGDSINFHTFRQIISTSDGGYAAVGQAGLVQYHPQIWVVKMDSNFDVEWQEYYGSTGGNDYFNGYHISEDFDGNLLVTGLYDVQPFVNNGIVYKIGDEGEALEIHNGNSSIGISPNNFGAAIIPVSSGGYICSSTVYTIEDDGDEVEISAIFRLNDSFNIMWEFEMMLNESRDFSTTKFIELPDGNFITTGSTEYYGESSVNQGHITKISPEGEVVWTRTLTAVDNGINLLFDIVQTPDGGYAAAGWLTAVWEDEFPGQSDAWVVKVDSMGCLVPGCHTVGVSELENQPSAFKIYPNPVNDYLNIYFKSLDEVTNNSFKLINQQGQLVKEFDARQNDTTYILDVSSFSEGIYYLTYSKDGIGVQTEKLLIEH